MTKGILLKLKSTEEHSAVDIINLHAAKAKKTGGEVYYATDLPISERQGHLESMIFCVQELPRLSYYIQADIVRILHDHDRKILPANAAVLSPKEYANQPKRTWIVLRNFRLMRIADVEKLVTLRPNEVLVSLLQFIKETPRLNRIYWIDPTTNSLQL